MPPPLSETYVKIATRTCPICHKQGVVDHVNLAGFFSWTQGAYIQVALPDLSPELREQMISGTHPECFDKAFKER